MPTALKKLVGKGLTRKAAADTPAGPKRAKVKATAKKAKRQGRSLR